jgi:hypothetical protein
LQLGNAYDLEHLQYGANDESERKNDGDENYCPNDAGRDDRASCVSMSAAMSPIPQSRSVSLAAMAREMWTEELIRAWLYQVVGSVTMFPGVERGHWFSLI